jgi:hypothetical protein
VILPVPHPLVPQIDEFIRRDPAQRGLIGTESQFGPLCPGHLAAAARDLAARGTRVAIVTGFYIPKGDPPAAETDGPPGSLLLATILHRLGIPTEVIADRLCVQAVRVAARETGFPETHILEFPHPAGGSGLTSTGSTDVWRSEYLSARPDLSHLIAIERAGPSHTAASIAAQKRKAPAPVEQFEQEVLSHHRDRCHNMRGEPIDDFTGDIHLLFEEISHRLPDARTIGIGDGGNEIGMGHVPWEELARRLSGEQAGRVPCRVACHWNIVAGTSNWGAYALAAALLLERNAIDLLQPFDADHQERVLQAMVKEGPAVDGVTRRREATVDGIPFRTYIQPWEGIRSLLGLG